jgi:hypothetical protein
MTETELQQSIKNIIKKRVNNKDIKGAAERASISSILAMNPKALSNITQKISKELSI